MVLMDHLHAKSLIYPCVLSLEEPLCLHWIFGALLCAVEHTACCTQADAVLEWNVVFES